MFISGSYHFDFVIFVHSHGVHNQWTHIINMSVIFSRRQCLKRTQFTTAECHSIDGIPKNRLASNKLVLAFHRCDAANITSTCAQAVAVRCWLSLYSCSTVFKWATTRYQIVNFRHCPMEPKYAPKMYERTRLFEACKQTIWNNWNVAAAAVCSVSMLMLMCWCENAIVLVFMNVKFVSGFIFAISTAIFNTWRLLYCYFVMFSVSI